MIGTTISHYHIESELGAGGIGRVYRATDTKLERPVAIKALHLQLASREEFRKRFIAEAKTMAKLNHTNITTLYNVIEHNDQVLLIMELVEGETLENIIEKNSSVSLSQSLFIFLQVLSAVSHAHEMGIVHRDIKPANIFVHGEQVKLGDFGIARAKDQDRMTRCGHSMGTLAYMAPEQIQGHEGDERSDIYALGILLYEMLTGQLPFVADNDFELINNKVDAKLRPLNSDVTPDAIQQFFQKATTKNPAKRFNNVAEMINAIKACIGSDTSKENTAKSTTNSVWREYPGIAVACSCLAIATLYVATTFNQANLQANTSPTYESKTVASPTTPMIQNTTPAQTPPTVVHSNPAAFPITKPVVKLGPPIKATNIQKTKETEQEPRPKKVKIISAPKEKEKEQTKDLSIYQTKLAYKSGKLTKIEYKKRVHELKTARKQEIKKLKYAYKKKEISKDAYKSKVRAVKLKYR